MKRADRWIVTGFSTALVAAIAAFVVFDLDIAGGEYFRDDVIFRGAPDAPPPIPYNTLDPSPHAIWIPSVIQVHRSLRDGELPWWDRRQGCGYSPFTHLQNGVLHPLLWLTVMVPERQAPSVYILICWGLCFLFTYAALRTLGLGAPASLFGAFTFALSAQLFSMARFYGPQTYLYLPALLATTTRWHKTKSAAWIAATSSCTALCLTSGHPLYAATILTTAGIAVHGGLFRDRARLAVLTVSGAAVSGVLIAGVVLVPFAVQLSESWSYKLASAQGTSFHVLSARDWIAAVGGVLWPSRMQPYLDHPSFFLYLGPCIVPLSLAGAALTFRLRRHRWVAVTLMAAFLVSIPGPWMAPIAAIPPLGWIRSWYWNVSLTFTAAVASAIAVDWIRPSRQAVLVAILAIPQAFTVEKGLSMVRPVRNWPLSSPGLEFLRKNTADGSRITALWGQTHLPNLSSMTEIDDLRLNSPLLDTRYHVWFLVLDPGVLQLSYPTTRVTHHLDSPLLGKQAVRYVLSSKRSFSVLATSITPGDLADAFPPDRWTLDKDRFPIVFEDDAVAIHLNARDVAPRVRFASKVHSVEGGLYDAALWMRRNTAALADTDVVEAVDRLDLASRGGATGEASVAYTGNNRVQLTVRADRDALVVLADTYADGWSAAVDGAAATIFPVNLLSRGVLVPSGVHTIEMRYVPPGLLAGAGVSLVGLLLLGALVMAVQKRATRIPTPPSRVERRLGVKERPGESSE